MDRGDTVLPLSLIHIYMCIRDRFNTFLFALGATVFQNLFAIVFAMALNTKIKSKNFLRMLLFAPCMLSPVVVAFIWQFIYMPDGMLNHLLGTDITWLGNRKTALFCVVIAHVWMWIGYSSTIYMSNLQSISTDILEAAAIDGAGPWQKFKSITLPMLAPATTINVTLAFTQSLKVFDIVYALSLIHIYFTEGADFQSAGDGGRRAGEQKGLCGSASQSGVHTYGYRIQIETDSGCNG